jgi:hypothetical protein
MKPRKGANAIRPGQPKLALAFLSGLFPFLWIAESCGVPGEPVPPSPAVPQAVTDLTASQRGDGVLLVFTPPNKSTRGERLNTTPTMEVLQGSLRADGLPDQRSLHVVDTVPGSVLNTYVQQGKVEFLEHFPPEEIRNKPAETTVFVVRTRVSERKSSENSNAVVVTLYAVPERIAALEVQEAENSIQLKWAPPKQTFSGVPLSRELSYHVYRGELDPASEKAARKDLHDAVWRSPLLEVATVTPPEYDDTGFDYGKTYVYVVRSAVNEGGKLLESDDSRPLILTPKDIFPPGAPQDVVAAVLPGGQGNAKVVDLSWGINVETDLAGYRVYRSEREGERGPLLTPGWLPSSAYRDSDVNSGRRYWYTVTAVDQAGNESAPSAALFVEIP